MEYKSKLQSLYDAGKQTQDQELSADDAGNVINDLGLDLGGYENGFKDAVTGMTKIEAFQFLNEILSRTDENDGTYDEQISGDFSKAMGAIGLGTSKEDINQKLILSADVFKEDDDPTDAENIEFLKSAQEAGKSGTNEGIKFDDFLDSFMQFDNFLNALGSTESKEESDNNEPLSEENASQIIDNLASKLGINFGEYAETLKEALKGMTEEQASAYLKEVLSKLDDADGEADGKITIKDPTGAFKDAGFGDTEEKIKEALLNLAEEIKNSDNNPTEPTPLIDYLVTPDTPPLEDTTSVEDTDKNDVTINGDNNTVEVNEDVEGDVTINGDNNDVEIGQDVEGDVTINGDNNEVVVNQDVEGDLVIEGNNNNVKLGNDVQVKGNIIYKSEDGNTVTQNGKTVEPTQKESGGGTGGGGGNSGGGNSGGNSGGGNSGGGNSGGGSGGKQ